MRILAIDLSGPISSSVRSLRSVFRNRMNQSYRIARVASPSRVESAITRRRRLVVKTKWACRLST